MAIRMTLKYDLKVVIQPRYFKTVQSGTKYAHQWQIRWKTSVKWRNPLMGWTSSADPMGNVQVIWVPCMFSS